MKRKLLALLLGTTMTVSLLAGCGQTEVKESEVVKQRSESSEAVSETEKEEVKDYTGVTFRVGWWGGDARNEATIKVLDEFARQFPGLTIETEYSAYGDYFTKVNTQAAAGNLPDVMQMDLTKVSMYAESGQIIEISSYIDDSSINVADVNEAVLDGCRYLDGLYGIPTGMNATAVLYNKTLLGELGLSISMTPTIDEYIELSKQVYEKTGALSGNISTPIYYRSFSGKDEYVVGENGIEIGYTLEDYITAEGIVAEGIAEGYFVGGNAILSETDLARLENREVWNWGCYNWTNAYASFQDSLEDEMALCAVPMAADGDTMPNYAKPNTIWSISKDSEHPEIAAAFLDFWTNSEFVYDTCGTDRGIPVSAAMADYVKAKATESEKVVYDYIAYMQDNDLLTPVNTVIPACASEVGAKLGEVLGATWYGDYPLEDLPKLAEEKYNEAAEILANNN